MKILDGSKLSQNILAGLPSSQKAKLAVVQVGNNPVSEKYIKEKRKAAKGLGVGFRLARFPLRVSEATLAREIEEIGKDRKVSGMIVQLPLPKSLNTQRVLDCIPLQKDVDVLSSKALGLFAQGALPWLPPTVKAVSILLKEAKVHLKGARFLVIGAGRLVGLPVSLWLLKEGATLTIANKATKNLSSLTKQADVIISGVGKRGLVKGNMVKKGAVVIDAGTSVESGPSTRSARSGRQAKLVGDVDFESVAKKAGYLSPVPGGVGPLTVACLFHNLTILRNLS
jgi:methylenetetrahydrofolate dehydrogenase (NADP+)/methenyltetrahydrofolate cyclohydrolase